MPNSEEYPRQERAKQHAIERYHHGPKLPGLARNVVGVGIGAKGTRDLRNPGVHIYVDRLMGQERGPLAIPGYADVPHHAIEAGHLFSFQVAEPSMEHVAPGTSIGLNFPDPDQKPNINTSGAGTLGALVKIGDDLYALGSNHVMAVNGRVDEGTEIVFRPPGVFINRDPGKFVFATTAAYVPLTLDPQTPNLVDCALARIEKEQVDRVKAEFPNWMVETDQVMEPALGMKVYLVDAEGPGIAGRVMDISAHLRLDYSFGTYDFDQQIIIEPEDGGGSFAFAKPGDSGGLIVGEDPNDGNKRKAVALIVGGSDQYAIACRLSSVFQKLAEAMARPKDGVRAGAPPSIKLALKTGT